MISENVGVSKINVYKKYWMCELNKIREKNDGKERSKISQAIVYHFGVSTSVWPKSHKKPFLRMNVNAKEPKIKRVTAHVS
jgi:hypothetical protein